MKCEACGHVEPEYKEYKRWAKMCNKRLGTSGAFPCVLDHDHFGPHVDRSGQKSSKIFIRTAPYDGKLRNPDDVGYYIEDPDVYHTYEEKKLRDSLRKGELQGAS